MVWAFVQAPTPTKVDNNTTITKAFSSTTTVGNRSIIGISFRNAFAGQPVVSSVTDSSSNTYELDKLVEILNDGSEYAYAALYSAPITTAGSSTVTVVIDRTAIELTLGITEYSGLNATATPIDQVAGAGAKNTSTANSGATSATAAANELVIGFCGSPNQGNCSFAPSGYTQRAALFSVFNTFTYLGDKDSGASGTTPSVSGALGDNAWWGAICAVYKLAAAASRIPRLTLLGAG